MGGQREEDAAAAAAGSRRWLEDAACRVLKDATELDKGGLFNVVPNWRLRVLSIGQGRAFCTFKVPRFLTDGDGNWQAGAILGMIDEVGAMAIFSLNGQVRLSVEFGVSYFSTVKAEEDVEIKAYVEHDKGRVSAVTVEVRKKDGGALVAIGRQWMISRRSSKI